MRIKTKRQYVLVCPSCGHDDRLIEDEEVGKFYCDNCEEEFDYHEADYTLKDLWEDF